MNKLINGLLKILGLCDETLLNYYNFMIGYQSFIILEIPSKDDLIMNDILNKIMLRGLDFYWFRSFEELEKYADYIIDHKDNNFIIIG